jgi:hypothetical protein
MSGTSNYVLLAVREILDKISSEDSFFPTEIPDITLPGPSTPESRALEKSIRSLVIRYQQLEQKTIQSPQAADIRPVTKQIPNVKENGRCENNKGGVCPSCGSRLDTVPLTPDETPPLVDASGSYVPRLTVSSGGSLSVRCC